MCVLRCPTDARVFGDLDDPESAISKFLGEKSTFVLLEEQGTRPQVRYFK